MNRLYLNIILGLSMTGIISIGGLIATPLLMAYFFPNQENGLPIRDHVYQIDFDYHNISEMTIPITSLGIYYRVFNSSKLQHPDPYFVGIVTTREGISKDKHRTNDSIWKFYAYQGFAYNEWNVAIMYGTRTNINPDIYVHHNKIAYEVTLFSQMLMNALSEAADVNISDYNYPKVDENSSELIIPGKWELSADIIFENATEINIKAHQDGWLESIRYHCLDWTTTEDGIPYCYGKGSESPPIYKEYGALFESFHQTFGDYVRTHIRWINEG